MMKKLLCLLLTFTLMLSSLGAVFAADGADAKVEISFKVGDSTLTINGTPVTVETPYIAGDGTTLVPLRVITEAFGAVVTWEGETKTIYLEYPDVNITLKIGSLEAIVNSHSETLPVAPELSASGVTMVPLRFISETFGAIVSYDEATKSITVLKEAAKEGSTIGSGPIKDMPRIGDSFYGWSMNTPTGMLMSDRSFDGTYTEFTDGNGASLYVLIYAADENTTFDNRYSEMRELYSTKYTLSQADKKTDLFGNQQMHFKARDRESYADFCSTLRGGVFYDIVLTAPLDSEAIPALSVIVDSFILFFGDILSTHDLSTVENGYRLFTDDYFKLSFRVPAECRLDEDSAAINRFSFAAKDGRHTALSLSVYSISESLTSQTLASKNHSIKEAYVGPEYANVTKVSSYNKPLGDNVLYYTVQTHAYPGGDFEFYDIFFEKGDYVYDLTVLFPNGRNDILNTVIDSFEAAELDKNAVGMLLETDLDRTSTYVSSAGSWSLTPPLLWAEATTPSPTFAMYIHKITGTLLGVNVVNVEGLRATDTRNFAYKYFDDLKYETFDGGVVPVTYNTYGVNGCYICSGYKNDDDGSRTYVTIAIIFSQNKLYQFIMTTDPLYYKGQVSKELEMILASLKVS